MNGESWFRARFDTSVTSSKHETQPSMDASAGALVVIVAKDRPIEFEPPHHELTRARPTRLSVLYNASSALARYFANADDGEIDGDQPVVLAAVAGVWTQRAVDAFTKCAEDVFDAHGTKAIATIEFIRACQQAMELIYHLKAGPLLAACHEAVQRQPEAVLKELYDRQGVLSGYPKVHISRAEADTSSGGTALPAEWCCDLRVERRAPLDRLAVRIVHPVRPTQSDARSACAMVMLRVLARADERPTSNAGPRAPNEDDEESEAPGRSTSRRLGASRARFIHKQLFRTMGTPAGPCAGLAAPVSSEAAMLEACLSLAAESHWRGDERSNEAMLMAHARKLQHWSGGKVDGLATSLMGTPSSGTARLLHQAQLAVAAPRARSVPKPRPHTGRYVYDHRGHSSFAPWSVARTTVTVRQPHIPPRKPRPPPPTRCETQPTLVRAAAPPSVPVPLRVRDYLWVPEPGPPPESCGRWAYPVDIPPTDLGCSAGAPWYDPDVNAAPRRPRDPTPRAATPPPRIRGYPPDLPRGAADRAFARKRRDT